MPRRLYLDSSSILKRYAIEPGTESVDRVYEHAESGRITLAFSVWNIGEVLGVLDMRSRRGWMSRTESREAIRKFAMETVKLLRLKILHIATIQTGVLAEAWLLILKQHIYEADALQIASCIQAKCDAFLSADKGLLTIAESVGLDTFNVEDPVQVERTLR